LVLMNQSQTLKNIISIWFNACIQNGDQKKMTHPSLGGGRGYLHKFFNTLKRTCFQMLIASVACKGRGASHYGVQLKGQNILAIRLGYKSCPLGLHIKGQQQKNNALQNANMTALFVSFSSNSLVGRQKFVHDINGNS
jgi:hypothetical protein